MKIAFFVSEFPTLSETFIANQVIGLKNKGHIVHIFSNSQPKDEKVHPSILKSGLLKETFFLNSTPKTRFYKILSLFSKSVQNLFSTNFSALVKSLIKNDSNLSIYNFILFIDKPEYDVVHAHFGENGNYVTQLKKLRLFKKAKFITTFHGYDLSNVYKERGVYYDLFKECNSFTVNSLYSKTKLVELGCAEKKISILPTGLDTSLFKKTALAEKKPNEINLLFVGRLIKLKGPDIFVEICKSLHENPLFKLKATMIGEGPMYMNVSYLIEKHGLKDVVIQKGAMTEEEVRAFMDSSDIFILPGIKDGELAETQGLVIQEAQCMQLPVLVSEVGGMKEGMLDNVTGFVLPAADIFAFVKKTELLAADVNLRKKMGEAGRQFVEKRYDIHNLNARLLNLYNAV